MSLMPCGAPLAEVFNIAGDNATAYSRRPDQNGSRRRPYLFDHFVLPNWTSSLSCSAAPPALSRAPTCGSVGRTACSTPVCRWKPTGERNITASCITSSFGTSRTTTPTGCRSFRRRHPSRLATDASLPSRCLWGRDDLCRLPAVVLIGLVEPRQPSGLPGIGWCQAARPMSVLSRFSRSRTVTNAPLRRPIPATAWRCHVASIAGGGSRSSPSRTVTS